MRFSECWLIDTTILHCPSCFSIVLLLCLTQFILFFCHFLRLSILVFSFAAIVVDWFYWLVLYLCCVFGSFFEFFINLLIMFLISSSFPIFFVVISKFLNECFIGVCFVLCCVPIYLCYWLKHAIPRWCSFLCLIIL